MLRSFAIAIAIALSLVGPAQAQGDVLAKCLADNTTGKDRKDLARWIFVAMAAHPEIRDLANAPPEAGDRASRTMAALVTRLLTESCLSEVRSVAAADRPQAMRRAFEVLGQLAMMELTSNSDVAASISGFERYVDRGRVNALLEGK